MCDAARRGRLEYDPFLHARVGPSLATTGRACCGMASRPCIYVNLRAAWKAFPNWRSRVLRVEEPGGHAEVGEILERRVVDHPLGIVLHRRGLPEHGGRQRPASAISAACSALRSAMLSRTW